MLERFGDAAKEISKHTAEAVETIKSKAVDAKDEALNAAVDKAVGGSRDCRQERPRSFRPEGRGDRVYRPRPTPVESVDVSPEEPDA